MKQSFSHSDAWIWNDGDLMPWKKAQTNLLTHAFQYGGGLAFEGERAYPVDGQPVIFRSEDHSRRLLASARTIGIETDMSIEDIEKAKYEVLNRNKYDSAYVRAFFWRSGSEEGAPMMGVNPAGARHHFAVAAFQDWNNLSSAPREAIISRWRRTPPFSFPPQAKSNIYGTSQLALMEAKEQGCNDAIVLDYEGYVAEGATANVTFLSDGLLHTPKADRFLKGITNDTVKAIAREEGYEIHDEGRVTVEDLMRAKEILLSGTAIEIVGVASIDGRRFATGALTEKFQSRYADLVRSKPETVQKFLKDFGPPAPAYD